MSEYNDLIAGDLSEASIQLIKSLEKNDLMNFRGVATMLAMASTMMKQMASESDMHEETYAQSRRCLDIMNENPLCIMPVLVQLSKIALEVHYGKTGGHA